MVVATTLSQQVRPPSAVSCTTGPCTQERLGCRTSLLDRGGLSRAVPGHVRTHLDVSRRSGIAPLQSTGSSWIEMCGRYNLISNLTVLGERFQFDATQLTLESAYNVAPTQDVLTVVGDAPRRAGFMRWGLIPFWAENGSIGSRMINARAETVADKPSFRDSFRRRRCLVLADGFYEWQRTPSGKRPMRVAMRSGEPFAFAGIWSMWKDPAGNSIPTCAIITTSANELLRPIHHRMPVILAREMEGFWLDRSIEDASRLRSILTPYPDAAMEAYEVSTLVNSVANDGPELITRVA